MTSRLKSLISANRPRYISNLINGGIPFPSLLPKPKSSQALGRNRNPPLPPKRFQFPIPPPQNNPRKTLIMEKSLRSSLKSSPQQFLLSASNLPLKSSKTLLKSLIHSVPPSSPLSTSLPSALHLAISQSIHSFTNPSDAAGRSSSPSSPSSPPPKRLRRSSRKRKSTSPSPPRTEPPDGPLHLKKLQIFAYVAHLCISHPRKPFQPSDLLECVRALHNGLIHFEADSALMLEIAGLCEEWWKEGLPGREALISQSLPFLLSRSLTVGKKVDIRRIYTLREAFSFFDFEDASIEDLKMLLARCVISPLYLKTEEGRRFLASLFGLDVQLVKEILALIRAQIPFGRKSMLEAYADILFRAWKEGRSRDEIENGLLQELVEGAILANSVSLAVSVRRVLGEFINQRTTDGVEKVLFRLVEPVLFRSLQVANSNVRKNALHLLLDMFPLEDPDATKEVKDILLEKQFFLLEKLLVDDCPDVRVVAVEGCCRILHLFWEVIPSFTITNFLKKIIDDMSHDVCHEVKQSTIRGIIYLLDNPQTHEILKVVLPRLGHMFLDPIISIRAAVADLLLALRDLRTFQFNKVVGLDALLSSLSSDQPLVAKKITRLLLPSYLPSKVTPREACNRCIALIRRSPTAGIRFCEFALSEGSSPELLVELFRVCISFSLSTDVQDTDQIDGFAVAAAKLGCSILNEEASNKNGLQELISGRNLKHLLSKVTSDSAHAAVLNVASMVSPNNAAPILEHSIGLITNCGGLSQNAEKQAEVRAAHKLLLSCGKFKCFYEALVNILQRNAAQCNSKFSPNMPMEDSLTIKRKKVNPSTKKSAKSNPVSGKRSVHCEMSNPGEDYVVVNGIAWQIKDLLVSVDTRKAVLDSPLSEIALSALKVISQVNIECCGKCDFLDISPVLAYTSLAIHMTLHYTDSPNLKDLSDKGSTAGSSPKHSLLDEVMNHLVNCSKLLFCSGNPGKCGSSISHLRQMEEKTAERCRSKRREALADVSNKRRGSGPQFPETKRIAHTVKMAATVLKFLADASTVSDVSHNYERSLQFASAYAQYIIATLDQQPDCKLSEEEDLKDAFVCLKSSFTYAAKLLHLALKSSSGSSTQSQEASYLAHNLLNLITSIELHIGSRYATHLIPVAKTWLPDLILALASGLVSIKTMKEAEPRSLPNHGRLHCPTWVKLIGKAELHELSKLIEDEQTNEADKAELSVFKRLIGVMVLMLKKGDPKILDAVGAVILRNLTDAMGNQDFGLVNGLVHFVCMRMVGIEYPYWKELQLASASLQGIYLQIEKTIQDPKIRHAVHKLENAKALIELIGIGNRR
ncbi:hypothetical protein ACLOJK_003582 [Asimina triloba]